MNKIFLVLFGIILGHSCAEKTAGEQKTNLLSNFLSITENEYKGVQEILGFFGGECRYSIGANSSTKEGTTKFFELEVNKSIVIDKQLEKAQMSSSNIAYLFYKNLKEERNNYHEIHIVLIPSKGGKRTFIYTTKQLERVEKRMMVVEEIINNLRNKNYDIIKSMLNNPGLSNHNKDDIIEQTKNFESQYGIITKGFLLFGFMIQKSDNGREILYISGVIIREKEGNPFSVYLDLNIDANEIILYDYKA